MSDIEQQRRLDILSNPTETTKIECKSWLDLRDSKNKAKLAKAAIAMANSGGGTIALGISEDETNGKKLVCKQRPSDLARYSDDDVGAAINKYAEPELEPLLVFENHPDTGEEYAFVEIAGGMQQPIFAKKQFNGEIDKFACYIRKPGPPRSEVPHTAQEWRDLMSRCVRASRDSMLDSIRIIMDGRPMDIIPTPSEEDQLREFMRASKERWQERLEEAHADEDDVARLKHGYWAFAFSILGIPTWHNREELRNALEQAKPGYDTRLFRQDIKPGLAPYAVEGGIEAWLGNPPERRHSAPHGSSFWRATFGGQFYHLEGFYEDNEWESRTKQTEPSTRHYKDHSIQLHAMMMRLAARLARAADDAAEIVICSEFTGLKGRYLTGSQAWWSPEGDGRKCSVPAVVLQPRRFSLQQIDDTLEECLYDLLQPFYEMFNFAGLNKGWVESAVESAKSHGW